MGSRRTTPFVGFSPNRPQYAAGIRIDPPPSVAVAIAAIPAAIAAPDPPDEPPGVRSRFHGFRVGPNRRFDVKPSAANSGMFVLPTTIAPAARSRSTTRASRTAGSASAKARDPYVDRMPATSV